MLEMRAVVVELGLLSELRGLLEHESAGVQLGRVFGRLAEVKSLDLVGGERRGLDLCLVE